LTNIYKTYPNQNVTSKSSGYINRWFIANHPLCRTVLLMVQYERVFLQLGLNCKDASKHR
jgi:hypothetical protein